MVWANVADGIRRHRSGSKSGKDSSAQVAVKRQCRGRHGQWRIAESCGARRFPTLCSQRVLRGMVISAGDGAVNFNLVVFYVLNLSFACVEPRLCPQLHLGHIANRRRNAERFSFVRDWPFDGVTRARRYLDYARFPLCLIAVRGSLTGNKQALE